MPKLKWTKDLIINEAKKYDSKKEFKSRNQSAYQACIKRHKGLIDELFKNQQISWTKELITKEAKKYSTKKDFEKGNKNAYQACINKHKGLIDELFDNQKRYWDEKSIINEAKKYTTKNNFVKGNYGAYQACIIRFHGLIDSLFENQLKSWDRESIIEEAQKYETKNEFKKANGSAYKSCIDYHKGLIDELFENSSNASENNIIYIWNTNSGHYKNKQIYKIGITSKRLSYTRIYEVANIKGWKPEIIALEETICRATDVEKQLLKLGEQIYTIREFDGATELRAMNESELNKALEIIRKYKK